MNLSDVRQWLLILALASSASGLASCGQKGPLYLPEEEEQEQPPAGQESRGPSSVAVA